MSVDIKLYKKSISDGKNFFAELSHRQKYFYNLLKYTSAVMLGKYASNNSLPFGFKNFFYKTFQRGTFVRIRSKKFKVFCFKRCYNVETNCYWFL